MIRVLNENGKKPESYSLEWYDYNIDRLENDIDFVSNIRSVDELDTMDDEDGHYYYSNAIKSWLDNVDNPREFRKSKINVINKLQDLIDDYEETKANLVAKVEESESLIKPMIDYIKETYEFVKYDDYVIYFNAPNVKYINDVVKDLARQFGLKPTGFGFDSSFTTHEASTPKTRALLGIGLVRKGGISECQVVFRDLRKAKGTTNRVEP